MPVLTFATNLPKKDFFSFVPPTPVGDAEEELPFLLKIDPSELKIFVILLNMLCLNIKDFIYKNQ